MVVQIEGTLFQNLITFSMSSCYSNQKKPIPGNSAGDLFGIVKWPFQGDKWPPTRRSKGHFESPGWKHLLEQAELPSLYARTVAHGSSCEICLMESWWSRTSREWHWGARWVPTSYKWSYNSYNPHKEGYNPSYPLLIRPFMWFQRFLWFLTFWLVILLVSAK